jgi:hypothetical protein
MMILVAGTDDPRALVSQLVHQKGDHNAASFVPADLVMFIFALIAFARNTDTFLSTSASARRDLSGFWQGSSHGLPTRCWAASSARSDPVETESVGRGEHGDFGYSAKVEVTGPFWVRPRTSP